MKTSELIILYLQWADLYVVNCEYTVYPKSKRSNNSQQRLLPKLSNCLTMVFDHF